jgi:hypothetical protein
MVIHIIESCIRPLQTPNDLLIRTVCSPTGVDRSACPIIERD